MKIETLYSCIICPEAFKTRQGLAGHMRKHRDIEFKQLHVRIPKDVADQFLDMCRRHKTTSCHMIYTLMKMTVKGEKMGVVDLGAKNPVVIQMISNFGGAPRGKKKYELLPIPYGHMEEALRCDHLRHREFEVGRLGWCSKCGRYVTPSNCLGCVERGKKGPPQF